MDSLRNILGQKNFEEPSAIKDIKKYVKDEFNSVVGVQIRERDIVIVVPNAALANTLRLRSQDIKRRYNIKKRLTFRIG